MWMFSLLTNYFLRSGTGNESKIASFTEIPFQEDATGEVLNAAFFVFAAFTELQMEIENNNTTQSVYKYCYMSILFLLEDIFWM